MKIEKNIPIPKATTGRPGEIADTLRKMEIGDSVLVSEKQTISFRSVSVSLGMKVSTRKLSDTEFRVWRTK